jgi:hypothetical protein
MGPWRCLFDSPSLNESLRALHEARGATVSRAAEGDLSKPPSPEGEGFERKKTVLQAKPHVIWCLIAFDARDLTEVFA